VHHTTSQYNLPELGTKIASKANREGVAERFAEPAVHQSIEVDVALSTSYDPWLGAVELGIDKAANHPDANTLSLVPTVPGLGKILSLVLLYEIHESERFASVQDVVS
jgi:hypothetical protein